MTASSIATLIHPTWRDRVPGLLLALGIGLLTLLARAGLRVTIQFLLSQPAVGC